MSILKRFTRKSKAPAEDAFLVDKELAPEFRTTLANIKSLVSQLEMMAGGNAQAQVEVEAPSAETPSRVAQPAGLQRSRTAKAEGEGMDEIRMKIMNGEELSPEERLSVLDALPGMGGAIEEEPMEDPEDEMMLARAAKATASDPADDRLSENMEETTDDAVSEVSESSLMKAILKLAGQKVEKQPESDPIAKAVLALAKQVNEQGEALSTLLKSLGYAEETIKKAVDEQTPKEPVRKDSSLTANDVGSIVREVMKGVGAPASPVVEDDPGTGLVESFTVRKSNGGVKREGLKTVLTQLTGAAAVNGQGRL